jgi:hypothetical protein
MCDACRQFAEGKWPFKEVANSVERHGALFRCEVCKEFYELIAEERGVRRPSESTIRRFYPGVLP